ncbi:MAG: hypothetical protein MJ170_04470 [Alphaproteobacteria bacterium]|nr:hypothetical protein [Alphaproteobacteria bacterium]
MNKFISGGFLRGHRTYILSGVGIVSAIASYLIGDTDVFTMLQAIFTLGGIYFLRKSSETKGNKNGTNTREISKQRRNTKSRSVD